jgi:GntR family transcriptional regulator / MocR family aminotransferase
MHPFTSLINLNKTAKTPLFLQIANQLMDNIKRGVIPKGTKLLGTRALAAQLNVHRQTVVAAYDELMAQGWIESMGAKGSFVSSKIPDVKPILLHNALKINDFKKETGFNFDKKIHLNLPILRGSTTLTFDDGFPDVRLAPVDDIARAYRTILKKGYQKNHLFYGDTKGEMSLREETTLFLKETRGLNISVENVMIARGSMMAIYLIAQTLLKAGDAVAVAELGYTSGNLIFKNVNANVLKIRLDTEGVDIAHLKAVCEKQPVRLVYITPHHHYPTTVTMPAERRLQLLDLATKYGFCILEDDYDYDFHYTSNPILPLASVDRGGNVVYIGSLCKSLSPAMRVGYIVAPSDLIEELGYLRRIIDRQGDNMLEAALALLFKDGTIKRHLKKSLKTYHKRRDLFCDMLQNRVGDVIDFKKPNGGMAVWAQYDPSVSVAQLSEKLMAKGLNIANGSAHGVNAIRMGFASQTEEEIEKGIDILHSTLLGY